MGKLSDVFAAVNKWISTPSNVNVVRYMCDKCKGTGKCPLCTEKSIKNRKNYKILLQTGGLVSIFGPMLMIALIAMGYISFIELPSDTSLIPKGLILICIVTFTAFHFLNKIHCPLCQSSATDIDNLGTCVICGGKGYTEKTNVNGGISLTEAYRSVKQKSDSLDNNVGIDKHIAYNNNNCVGLDMAESEIIEIPIKYDNKLGKICESDLNQNCRGKQAIYSCPYCGYRNIIKLPKHAMTYRLVHCQSCKDQQILLIFKIGYGFDSVDRLILSRVIKREWLENCQPETGFVDPRNLDEYDDLLYQYGVSSIVYWQLVNKIALKRNLSLMNKFNTDNKEEILKLKDIGSVNTINT